MIKIARNLVNPKYITYIAPIEEYETYKEEIYYYVHVYIEGGINFSEHFKTREEAEARRTLIENQFELILYPV